MMKYNIYIIIIRKINANDDDDVILPFLIIFKLLFINKIDELDADANKLHFFIIFE